MHEPEHTRINNSDLIRLVASINRAVWDQGVHAVLTDREMFIAVLSSIKFNCNETALWTSGQAHRIEQTSKFRRSRDWRRAHGTLTEIQQFARHDE